jgi:dTDP-4-amino-4,6-dideoxygalactose transaminase
MSARIPSVRLDNAATWEAIRPELERLVKNGQFILGDAVEEFERRAAAAFACRWAVGTSSGTSALVLALRAAGLPLGARVAIPANTFFATLEAVVIAGHEPVVVDVDEDHLIDLDQLAELRLDAVIPVHLYGLPVDMPALVSLANEHGWWLLEDASQAHGATIGDRPVGSFGDAAAFSAYPTKNLGAWGDAGFVTGTDPAVADHITALRHHGQRSPNVHGLIGGTERLDAIQALVLTAKLSTLADDVARRRDVASRYRSSLDGLDIHTPHDVDDRHHAYHQFVIRAPRRDDLRTALNERGVETGIHYPTPVHLQPAARGVVDVPRQPRRAERYAREILSLPMYPSLGDEAVSAVAEAIRGALKMSSESRKGSHST